MANEHHTQCLIIGAGPAGYTAAIYAARANLKPILVQGMQPGGQLTITTDVENYPGFADPVQGPWLMEQFEAQARHVGTTLLFDVITEVDFSRRPFVCMADSGDRFVAHTVIIATGAQARWLGLAGEKRFQGYGVSACATCDGAFFREREVAVIGGGNSAMEEALFLTNFAKKVTLIHRRDKLRGEKILQDRVFRHPKITVLWDSVVEDIVGDEQPHKVVKGVRLKNLKTGASEVLACDGVFVAIGHEPATALFKDKLPMDEGGYLLTAPDSTATRVPGVFAAGDVRDKVFRQAVTAAGMGCMAALEAERFLAAHEDTASRAA
ncbi:NAD(P)/FAD-dependent oxidoreductase [Candidatus Raskinella chloraquaticus]|uniref:Thioredoxin reductase n=1 Tax=Candidatus Raskinella chloraquaticus TaxID=1951219 RepID=A0A1W9I4Z5_9HYPH|nr:MAG: thioredoxin-disulfide reductase [Proteobacteria bacterium SG_bin8]